MIATATGALDKFDLDYIGLDDMLNSRSSLISTKLLPIHYIAKLFYEYVNDAKTHCISAV